MAYEDVYRSLKIRSGKLANVKSQFTMALPGTFAEFGFPFNAETLTEQAAGYAKVYDASAAAYLPLATSSSGAGYTANYQLFPDTEAVGDYAIFGGASKFGVMYFDMSATGATYSADGITWQYWNGDEWSTLTIVFDTTNTTPAAGGKRPFMQDGYIVFDAPSDWAKVEIDDQEAYWVRAYVNAATLTQIPLTNSKEHQLVSSTVATEVPADGELVRGRFTFTTNSGANADSKIILCDLTSGACSAIKTLTKALNQGNEVADFDMTVSAGDALAIFGTDEDGTTEFADGMVEIDLLRK